MSVVQAWIVPGQPHLLLAPQANAGWARLRAAYEEARRRIQASGADTIVLYSTRWVSVIGHQVQADPEPVWTHVDEEWHELGAMPYRFRMDPALAARIQQCATERGLHARTVAYKGFPIDTGTVVALSLLDPERRLGATVVSCNMYADRAETLVLGKAVAEAVRAEGRRAVAVAVTALSNRQHHTAVPFDQDHIHSRKDDEWNRKVLEFLAEGRVEDVSQLARQFTREANADSRFKALWWLAAVAGQDNRYRGEVLAYAPVYGAGAAVVQLDPGAGGAGEVEFDEDDVEVYAGDRDVLAGPAGMGPPQERPRGPAPLPEPTPRTQAPGPSGSSVLVPDAPRPVGAYPHARRVGELLYLSGIGPRQAGTDAIPGGPVRDHEGRPLAYDVAAQTRACVENVRRILEASGSALEKVVDVTVFLIDMERDFASFNAVYAELLGPIGPTRTTVEVRALPTPIAVELKVVALP